jgi:hypothetical protein
MPARNRNFTGRVELLERLAAALRNGGRTPAPPQTPYGLGGVGKTQLAVEYVHHPQAAAAAQGLRLECDIEPPPT